MVYKNGADCSKAKLEVTEAQVNFLPTGIYYVLP